MKKFMLILVVLTVVFISCASPVDEAEEPAAKVNPFLGKWLSKDDGIGILEFLDTTWQFIWYDQVPQSGKYEYDNTCLKQWQSGSLSHIFTLWTYEFKNAGNELHLILDDGKNIYGVIPATKHQIWTKIVD